MEEIYSRGALEDDIKVDAAGYGVFPEDEVPYYAPGPETTPQDIFRVNPLNQSNGNYRAFMDAFPLSLASSESSGSSASSASTTTTKKRRRRKAKFEPYVKTRPKKEIITIPGRKYYLNKPTKKRRRANYKHIAKIHGARGSETSIAHFGKDWASATDTQKLNRQAYGFFGHGGYASMAMAGLGGIYGGVGGAMSGFSKGWRHGKTFAKMHGYGDYGAGSANQIIMGSDQQAISVNRDSRSGDIFIEHTEFVGNLIASGSASSATNFQVTQYPINPGLSTVFPFLSQLALNYELYEFQGLIFQYKPTSGEYGNNNSNALGKVIFATNYDPDAPAFLNSIQMENYDYANATKPSCGLYHGVETAPGTRLQNMMYVRTGAVTRDKIFTDLGTLNIATEGIPLGAGTTSQLCGEIWVTYRIRLSRAQLFQNVLGGNVGFYQAYWNPTTPDFCAGLSPYTGNNFALSRVSSNSTSVTFEFPVTISAGAYWITLYGYTGSTVTNYFLQYTPTNGTIFNSLLGGVPFNAPRSISFATNNTDRMMQAYGINVNAPGATKCSFTVGVNSTVNGNAFYIVVTQVPISVTV